MTKTLKNENFATLVFVFTYYFSKEEKMKKIWNVVAVLFVLATMGLGLAGCANDTNSSSNGDSNPFVGTWITTSAMDDGEGEMLWGKYVFDESTVTIYSSSNKILWSQGYQSNYSWSGNTCQLQTGYSGSIRGGKLYFSFGDFTVEMERE